MKIDTSLPPISLGKVPHFARSAEEIGFSAVWTMETKHDPFLPCMLISEHTRSLEFGTGVAISFARSPATLAYSSWDLAEYSRGRFVLGIGTQVKGHITRRFGMDWPSSPVNKLKEQVSAIREFWNIWQNRSKLNFKGKYYKLNLMTPFFNPGPIEYPQIPIFLAGVNPGMVKLAGEIADGFHVHPFHSRKYLEEVTLPSIKAGLQKCTRSREEITLSTTAFTATNDKEREFVRQQISFYASTPSYRIVMETHGWQEVSNRLSYMASKGKWTEMPDLITDEMLSTFAVIADPKDLPGKIISKYAGLTDRLTLYTPFIPQSNDRFWRNLIGAISDTSEQNDEIQT